MEPAAPLAENFDGPRRTLSLCTHFDAFTAALILQVSPDLIIVVCSFVVLQSFVGQNSLRRRLNLKCIILKTLI